MKQHINVKQLEELSEEGRGKLKKWIFRSFIPDANQPVRIWGQEGDFYIQTNIEEYLLSIGQMIEFLELQHGKRWPSVNLIFVFDENGKIWQTPGRELCDALWEAVKEVLEKKS